MAGLLEGQLQGVDRQTRQSVLRLELVRWKRRSRWPCFLFHIYFFKGNNDLGSGPGAQSQNLRLKASAGLPRLKQEGIDDSLKQNSIFLQEKYHGRMDFSASASYYWSLLA